MQAVSFNGLYFESKVIIFSDGQVSVSDLRCSITTIWVIVRVVACCDAVLTREKWWLAVQCWWYVVEVLRCLSGCIWTAHVFGNYVSIVGLSISVSGIMKGRFCVCKEVRDIRWVLIFRWGVSFNVIISLGRGIYEAFANTNEIYAWTWVGGFDSRQAFTVSWRVCRLLVCA